jgi:hypothetical protein
MWIDPGWVARLLFLSALPVFLISAVAITGLGKIGIGQLSSFMSLTPALIVGWYYFIGWLLDRWSFKRSQPPAPSSDYRSRQISEY